MKKTMDTLSELFIYPLKLILTNRNLNWRMLQEIRVRTDKPVTVLYGGKEFFAEPDGSLVTDSAQAVYATQEMIRDMMQVFSSYSLYAFEEEIRQGFLTIPGGHRIGICGKMVLDNEKIKTIRYISSVNIRLSHEVKGCADTVMPYLYEGQRICNTLIVGAPCSGKTTLLRDLIRQLSDGSAGHSGVNVSVIDERSEIGACYLGIPQNDIGIRTDILDCCPKREGLLMLLRSMAPAVIAVDEIGNEADHIALRHALYCGCKLISTVHGYAYDDLYSKPLLKMMLEEGVFERFIILDAVHKAVHQIMDKSGKILYERGSKAC